MKLRPMVPGNEAPSRIVWAVDTRDSLAQFVRARMVRPG